jgi:hypothetical protein
MHGTPSLLLTRALSLSTGPISRRRFASVGAAIDIGEDVALADVPGHLVAAFEASCPPNAAGNALDSDARSALVMTTLEADGCEVHLNGAPVPHNKPVSLCPGALLSFGGVTYMVERDARAHA